MAPKSPPSDSSNKPRPPKGAPQPASAPKVPIQQSIGQSSTQPPPPAHQSSRHNDTKTQSRTNSQHSSTHTSMSRSRSNSRQNSGDSIEEPASASQDSLKESASREAKFRCVQEGQGGTLTIDSKSKGHFIGTIDCNKDVGIYFRVDSKRAFCARICVDTESVTNIISDEEGRSLCEQVCERLKDEAKDKKWVGTDELFGKNFTIVCHRPMLDSLGVLVKGTGWYIIEGIRMWGLLWWVREFSRALNARPISHYSVLTSSFPRRVPNPSEYDMETYWLYQRMQTLVSGFMPNMMSRELRHGGNGFVVDGHSNSEGMIFKRNETFPINKQTNELITATEYVERPEQLDTGRWMFGKDSLLVGPIGNS